jgi:hypothetical protein
VKPLRPKIRLDFCDFGPEFRKADNFFYHLLKEPYDLQLCDQADFVIYSPYGDQHRLHTGVRIFFSQESGPPDYTDCDYSFTCHHLEDPRHCRLPLYVTYGSARSIVRAPGEAEQILAGKTRFCGFVASNHHPRKNRNRLEMFERLSAYRRVDSGGRFMNNMGGPLPGWSAGKVEFLRTCKFNLCFENAAIPGYTTEKLFEAMQARTIPIYWGDPRVGEDFNPKSFLNRADFPSTEALAQRVIELDRDDEKYLAFHREPYLHGNVPSRWFDQGRLLEQFERIFSTRITPVGHRRRWFQLGRWRLVRRNQVRVGPGTRDQESG